MATAFQVSAFQNNAFQIDAVIPSTPNGGGNASGSQSRYEYNTYEISKAAYNKNQKELQDLQFRKLESLRLSAEKEAEIQALEQKRLNNLSDTFYQKQLLRLLSESMAIAEQSRIIEFQVRAKKIEEEDIFVLLLCMPFMA